MTPAEQKERPYSSAVAVERAADLLFLIAEQGEASLTDLARSIGSSGSAVHRILTALKNKGLIEQPTENGPYALSWSILALTHGLTGRADLRSLSLPFMRELRDLAGETVTLNIPSGFDRLCIDQVEGPHEVSWRQEVGKLTPLYGGATGKVILAHMPPSQLKAFFRAVKLEQLTPNTTVDRADLVKELEAIRAQGYAIADQDRLIGAGGLAAPIFDATGKVAGTLTIAGPVERCSPEQLEQWVEPITSATGEISRLLAGAAVASAPGDG